MSNLIGGSVNGAAGITPAVSFSDRPYQTKVIDKLVQEERGLIRAPTGAGKTYIALKAAKQIGYTRLLIVVPRYSAFMTWKSNLSKMGFSEEVIIVEKWNPKKRTELWVNKPDYPQIVMCLYNTVTSDVVDMAENGGFDLVICDESHRIRNRKTLSFKAMKVMGRHRKIMFLTATPQSKGPQDLWTTLHILSPGAFSSYWKFVNRYCVIENGEFGKSITGVKKSTLQELRTRIDSYVFNIPDSELKGFVPERVRKPMYTKVSSKVWKVYKHISEHLVAMLPDDTPLTTQSVLSATTKLRQLLICPKVVHEALGYGSGIETIVEHLINNNQHCVIFCPFTEPMKYIREYLELHGIDNVFILRGGMKLSEVETVIGQYERLQHSNKPSVLICSTSFAESFDLLTPTTAYFLGYDWDQNVNYQAEGRLTRGAKTHCNFFYVIHEDTVDTAMLQVLDGKVRTTGVLFRTAAELVSHVITF